VDLSDAVDLAESGPAEVGELGGQAGRLGGPVDLILRRGPLRRRPPGTVRVEPVAAGALGHSDDGVGQEQPVLRIQAGVDERVDGLGDRLLHPPERGTEFDVVRGVTAVQQAEGVLVVDHELEVAGEAELDLLTRTLRGRSRLDDPIEWEKTSSSSR